MSAPLAMTTMEERETFLPTETLENFATSAANQTRINDFTENVANIINVFYTPLLVILGTIGNILSIIVFYRSRLRRLSTGLYLSALAVSDTVFLFLLLPPWLKAIQLTELFSRPIFCQTFIYMSYVSCGTSTWLVVAFTVERFVAVVFPLRCNDVCTMARARYVICGQILSSLALNLPMLRMTMSSEDECNINSDFIIPAARFNLVDTTFSFSLPLGVIIILNVWIMRRVRIIERTRRRLMEAQNSYATSLARARLACRPGYGLSQLHITRMLLIVSTVFVLLNLPAYTMRIITYAYDMSDDQYTGRWAAWQQIALSVFNTNFGINFILYCLTGQNFRHALLKTIPFLGCARRSEGVQRAGGIRLPPVSSDLSSSMSMCLGPTYNVGIKAPAVTEPVAISRRNRRIIKRWKFYHRQQLEVTPPLQEDVEMQTFSSSYSEAAGPSGIQQSPSLVTQAELPNKKHARFKFQ